MRVWLEDYTPSEEIGLLDKGIDRYFGTRRPRYERLVLHQTGSKCSEMIVNYYEI
jgi:hypothetical protein